MSDSCRSSGLGSTRLGISYNCFGFISEIRVFCCQETLLITLFSTKYLTFKAAGLTVDNKYKVQLTKYRHLSWW